MIVTCVADVLPTCTVAGSPDQKQKYNFERRYCYYIMITVHRQLITSVDARHLGASLSKQ